MYSDTKHNCQDTLKCLSRSMHWRMLEIKLFVQHVVWEGRSYSLSPADVASRLLGSPFWELSDTASSILILETLNEAYWCSLQALAYCRVRHTPFKSQLYDVCPTSWLVPTSCQEKSCKQTVELNWTEHVKAQTHQTKIKEVVVTKADCCFTSNYLYLGQEVALNTLQRREPVVNYIMYK